MTATLPAYGSTPEGWVGARSADFLDVIWNEYETRTGKPADRSPRNPLTVVFTIEADLLGQASQALQVNVNARRRANATGQALDDLGIVSAVSRLDAAPSTAPALFTGTPGTAIPFGRIVRCAGVRWLVAQDVTIGGGGTASGQLRAVDDGPTFATTSDAVEIVSVVDGWTAVELTASATPGRAFEGDDVYRVRQAASLQVGGLRNTPAIRARLLELDGVAAAEIQDNDEGEEVVKNGITMPPGSIAVIVYPELTADQEAELAAQLYDEGLNGIWFVGSTAYTVTGSDLAPKVVRWTYGDPFDLTIAYVLTMQAGYLVADVSSTIQAAVAEYVAGLRLGATVSILALYGIAARVAGVRGAAITINGSGVDVVLNLSQAPNLLACNVS